MGDMSMNDMVAELQRRITQLNTPTAEKAINRAIRWSNRQGSYNFQIAPPFVFSVGPGVFVTAPADMDMGKAHFMRNNDSQLPVKKVGIEDLWLDNAYDIPSAMFAVISSYTIEGRTFAFRQAPPAPVFVTLHYHLTTVDIAGTQPSNLPRDFDDLIIDLAEAEERRIFDVGEVWVPLLARCQDQIRVLLDGYRSVSMQPMPQSDAAVAIAEKSQTGQA